MILLNRPSIEWHSNMCIGAKLSISTDIDLYNNISVLTHFLFSEAAVSRRRRAHLHTAFLLSSTGLPFLFNSTANQLCDFFFIVFFFLQLF